MDHDALSAYTERLFAPEDDLLCELREEIGRRGMPEIYISAEVGRMLQVLLAAVGAERVVEIGTLGGYSAIWMARALPGHGRLVTLEADPAHAELARDFVRRAGLGDRIDVRLGRAPDALVDLEGEGPFDACFIDADKERYPDYLDWALAHVRSGGLILGDNAFRGGRVLEAEPDDATRGIQEFNRRMAESDALVSTILPVRDGVAVGVRR